MLKILFELKKYISIFLITLIIISGTSINATDNLTQKLEEIEKTYLGYSTHGNTIQRLSHLEKSIYGTTSTKSDAERINKLYNDLNIETKSQTLAHTKNENLSQNIGPKSEANIKYPIVDKMEEKVFNKNFAKEDIYNRLSRLEKQTFHKENNLSLNERVDLLRTKILTKTQNSINEVIIDPNEEEIILGNGQKYVGDDIYSSVNNDNENTNFNYYSYENSKMRISDVPKDENFYSDGGALAEKYAQSYDLDILEKNLLGQRYTSEVPSKRLARLESKIFQRTFSDDTDARIQRLLAVTTAQKTSQEYDSNKWARRINAGIQVGSILLMVLAMIL